MLLWGWRRERFIKKVLKKLSRQRVEAIDPDGVWVVTPSVKQEEDMVAAVRTCHIRGWVEPFCNAIPHGQLTADGKFPEGELFSGAAPVYRLTEAGWNEIHRLHTWVVVTCVVALITLMATVVGLVVTLTR